MGHLTYFVLRFMTIWSWPNKISPLTDCQLSPMVRMSIDGPYLLIVVHVRGWVNGVLIQRYRLRIVVWLTNRRFVRGLKLSQFFWIQFWESFSGKQWMCSIGRRLDYGPSIVTVDCTYRFLKNWFLVCLGYGVLHYLPLGTFVIELRLN